VAILVERSLVLSYFSVTRTLISESRHLIQHHRLAARHLREDIAGVWLERTRQRLASGIRLLNVVALLAPLLGLLGTVIGLIHAFDTLALHDGPIVPALLAEGLGMAMKTTAAGLIIAVPAVLGAHGFQLWIDRLIQHVEHRMNIDNLTIDGICTEALT